MTLGGNMYILAVYIVFGMVGWNRGWVTWRRLGMSSGVATHGGICMRVAIRAEMAGSVSSSLRGSSIHPVEGGDPMVTDDGSLLGVLHWETRGWGCRGSPLQPFQGPCRCKVMPMAMSWGGSMVLAREWVSTSVVVEAWMVVVMLWGCALLRSMSRSSGSQRGSPAVAESYRGSSGKVNCRASSSPFKPSGPTTLPLSSNSLHFAAGEAGHRHPCWVWHLSWHWCTLCLIRAHGIWHHKGVWPVHAFVYQQHKFVGHLF